MAQHRHTRDANARRRTPSAIQVAGPVAVLATLSAVAVGVMTSTPSVPGMMTKGILDKHDYYYRRLFTDAVRAVDMLVASDFVDADRIAVCGGSQGGGIALAVAGLDSRVKAVMTDVPKTLKAAKVFKSA